MTLLLFLILSHLHDKAKSLPTQIHPTSNATCLAGPLYTWTMNAEKQSPCLLAATVIAPCNTNGGWNVPALRKDFHYDPPNSENGTVTTCYCSWAAYNLINACTACQGSESMITWAAFSQNCGNKASRQDYYPAEVTSLNVSIPYYATQNPMLWSNFTFNVTQAKVKTQGQPDINLAEIPTTSTSSSSASPTVTVPINSSHVSVGAIAGGVTGGLAVICISVVIVIWLLRRQRSGGDDDSARTRLLKPEERIEPFTLRGPMVSSSSLPGRVKSPPISLAETHASTKVSTTNCTHGSGLPSTRPLSPEISATPEVIPEPTGADDSPVSSHPDTNPPPYRHTPQIEPAVPQFLSSSQETAVGLRDHIGHSHNLSRGDVDSSGSPWSSFGSVVESNIAFASMRASSTPLNSALISSTSLGRHRDPRVRFGGIENGHSDEEEIVRRIA